MADDKSIIAIGDEKPTASNYLPRIRTLYRKHLGLTRALSCAFEEAAGVCLEGSAVPPTRFDLRTAETLLQPLLRWRSPTTRERRAWANATDCVEAASCGVALSAVEAALGLVAIERASTCSGADYYVASAPGDYLEHAVRLEVSGTASADPSRIHERMRKKLQQVAHPADPSLACVVSFGARVIVIAAP